MQRNSTLTAFYLFCLANFAVAGPAGATGQPLPTSPVPAPEPATDYPVRPVPFTAVRVTNGLWKTKQLA